MKITCSKKEMLEGLDKIKGGIGSKTTMPILNNLLLETTPTKLRLTATDFEITVKCLFGGKEVKITEEGAITIPAKKLMEMVKELPDDDITITTDEKNSIKIKCQKVNYKIMGLPDTEYPKIAPSKKASSELAKMPFSMRII